MKKVIFITAFAALMATVCSAKDVGRTSKGVRFPSQGMDVNIEFYSPEIVRVYKSPEGKKYEKNSLVVTKTPENVDLKFSETGDKVTVESSAVKVVADTEKGTVDFYTPSGELLLKDSATTFTDKMDAGKPSYTVKSSFMLEKDEPIYGVGQIMDGKMSRRNSRHHLQNENMFTSSPYFISPTKGYAVYVDNYSISDFEDTPQELSFQCLGDGSDYYFMYGDTPDDIISEVRELTGHSPMLPLWAYGFFQSKERYHTQDENLGILKKYRDLRVPIDCMIQDWRYWPEYNHTDSAWNSHSFDPERFPNPEKWVEDIHALNGKLLIVAWPGFGPKTYQRKELDSKGMIIEFDTWPPESGARPYDVFNPEARDIYWKSLDKGIFSKIGNDGWWLDSTEPDHINRQESDYDQPTHLGSYRSMKNAYSLMHNTGIAEHQKAQNRDKRVVILTRSGFVGQQRLGSNTWSGDVQSTWEMLEKQIPAALNFTLMGIPNWNSDIGGFFAGRWNEGGGAKNPEYQELYTRWMQFGAFCPMMRSHGTEVPREIWNFGEEGDWCYDAQKKAIELRYRMLPYIYSTSWDVSANDGTFMRPLVMDFVDDKNVYELGSEYMFGRSLLVAPVTRPGVSSWDVYLPSGAKWWDFWTNTQHNGGATVSKDVPKDIIPLYVKAGSVMPFGPDVQYSTEKPWDNLEIRVYPGADGSFTLYEDENDNYNYENGAYSTIDFKWDDAKKTLTISDRKGDFPGMLKKRKFNVVLVNDKSGAGNAPMKGGKEISYSGKKTKVKFGKQ